MGEKDFGRRCRGGPGLLGPIGGDIEIHGVLLGTPTGGGPVCIPEPRRGIPRPLLLTREAGAGPLHHVAAQVLALTKMDWNNDALYDGLPCTVRYAKILAKTIKHIPDLAPQPYEYRLFM